MYDEHTDRGVETGVVGTGATAVFSGGAWGSGATEDTDGTSSLWGGRADEASVQSSGDSSGWDSSSVWGGIGGSLTALLDQSEARVS